LLIVQHSIGRPFFLCLILTSRNAFYFYIFLISICQWTFNFSILEIQFNWTTDTLLIHLSWRILNRWPPACKAGALMAELIPNLLELWNNQAWIFDFMISNSISSFI
jgi:hypothetical protein